MHVHVPVLVLVCASLMACGASPQPATPKPASTDTKVVTPPAPAAPVVADAKPAPVTASAPAPATTPPAEGAAAAANDPLARAGSCVGKEPGDSNCAIDPGVLGFHADGRILTVMAPELGSCGDDNLQPNSFARVSAQDAIDRAPQTAFAASEGDDDGSKRAWAFLAEQAKAGFMAATDLIASTESEISGIRGVHWAADLKAPLAGWRVSAKQDPQATLKLQHLGDKTSVDLGALPAKGRQPSIEQVVLNPERTHLFVLVSFSDGSHCGSDPLFLGRYALPPAALAALR